MKQINDLTSDTIYVGQVLKLKQQSNSTSNQTPQSTTDTYTVQSGDTLWGIANTHDTTVNNLKQINDLTSDTIYVGQVLKLKQRSTTQQESSHQVNQIQVISIRLRRAIHYGKLRWVMI